MLNMVDQRCESGADTTRRRIARKGPACEIDHCREYEGEGAVGRGGVDPEQVWERLEVRMKDLYLIVPGVDLFSTAWILREDAEGWFDSPSLQQLPHGRINELPEIEIEIEIDGGMLDALCDIPLEHPLPPPPLAALLPISHAEHGTRELERPSM
jgi:hypothetical protein